MALPKRRHSKSRRNKKRTHQGIPLDSIAVVTCSRCSAAIRPHNACSSCGYYKGRQVDHTVKQKDKSKARG
jgi:large subunit ribosomal protein L32